MRPVSGPGVSVPHNGRKHALERRKPWCDVTDATVPPEVMHWLPVALVVLLLAAAGASYAFELGPRWLGTGSPDPTSDPVAVEAPQGVDLPAPVEPAPVAAAVDGVDTTLDVDKVAALLGPLLSDPDLGPSVQAAVVELDAPAPVYLRGRGAAVPASTLKLLTATAALAALGPDHTFSTTVRSGPGKRIVLVGGGDPLLARTRATSASYPPSADVATLARRTAAALREQGVRRVRLDYDDTLFTGPAVNPRWPATYVPEGVVSPISSLWVDEGREFESYRRVGRPGRHGSRGLRCGAGKLRDRHDRPAPPTRRSARRGGDRRGRKRTPLRCGGARDPGQ